MCECIKELQQNLEGKEIKGKKVVSAKLVTAAIMFDTFDTRTISEVEITLEGQKKKTIQNIVNSYCPFCGRKYS